MDAPFGIAFLKKAELYNVICHLDKQYRNEVKSTSFRPSSWSIEKQILKWTYKHHIHLGTPITMDDLGIGPKNKLNQFGMVDKNGNLKKEFEYLDKMHLSKPLENLVIRGFANYYDEKSGHNAVVINKEGLLVGEVLADVNQDNPLVKINYIFYSSLIDHTGAFVLIIITILGLLKLLDQFHIF